MPDCLGEGSVLLTRQEAVDFHTFQLTARACLASSTDHARNESVHNVLSGDFPRIERGNDGRPRIHRTWWSSSPTQAQNTNEVLVFATRFPVVLLTHVSIKPLLDPYNSRTVYSWKRTVVRAYCLEPFGEYRTGIPWLLRTGISVQNGPPHALGVVHHTRSDKEMIHANLVQISITVVT